MVSYKLISQCLEKDLVGLFSVEKSGLAQDELYLTLATAPPPSLTAVIPKSNILFYRQQLFKKKSQSCGNLRTFLTHETFLERKVISAASQDSPPCRLNLGQAAESLPATAFY